MDRRSFLKQAGIAGAAATLASEAVAQQTPPAPAAADTKPAAPEPVAPKPPEAEPAAPAVASSTPKISWRCATSWSKSQEAVHGAAEMFADIVRQATDGNFEIELLPEGEAAPGKKAAEAAADGSVEMAHTASALMWEEDPAYAIGTAIAFGPNARLQNAWTYHGGGRELLNEFYATKGLIGFACGNRGAQMGGWFREEIDSVEDLKGLKLNISGLAARIAARVGVEPQQIAADEVLAALEAGTIDGTKGACPYEDEKLGLAKAAPYYYYPGWWEGGSMLHNFINLEKFDALPKNYQAIIDAASRAASADMLARYDVGNPPALKRLVAGGAQLRPLDRKILDAFYKAAKETHAEIAAENPAFKKIYDSLQAFVGDEYLWMQFPDYRHDAFLMVQQRAGNL